MKDYYQILGVSPSATAQEIRQAYRRLVVLYHPDKNPDASAQQMIREVNLAYDVLGDERKRRMYDLKFPQSWVDVFQQAPERPVHRDPRYRRAPAQGSNQPKRSGQFDLMKAYLPYVITMCYAGLFVTSLLWLDLLLPLHHEEDVVEGIYSVRGRRNSYIYDIIVMESGRSMRAYNREAETLLGNPNVIVNSTRIYLIPFKITNHAGEQLVRLGYIYRHFVFFPLILFVTSLLGVIYRKQVTFPFNLSIVSAILLILNLYFIFKR